MDFATLEQRKMDLENYLNMLLTNDFISSDEVLHNFLEEKEFVAPSEIQFSALDWLKKTLSTVQNSQFSEMKEYFEAMMKTTVQGLFKGGENEIDTAEVDRKMHEVIQMGNRVNSVI